MRSLGLLALVASLSAVAADWPTYRHDNARTGVTAEQLKTPLAPCWAYQPAHKPKPAWGDPNPRQVGGWFGLTEKRRVHFDDVFHVAVAGQTLYFGSSADGKVCALDVATGKVRWSTPTDGPVRLTPSVADGKVYVGSDDGFAYCLKASDGSEVWRFRAAPTDEKVLGSGKMISLWPLRTGVLVDGGTAYLSSGIFPAEGVYLHAVNAADGKPIWCNDEGGAKPQSRISPQGHLLASADALFVPMGRVSPASYDRKTGKLTRETYFTHYVGGTQALLDGGQIYTGTEQLVAYDAGSAARRAWFDARQILVADGTAYVLNERELAAITLEGYGKPSLEHHRLVERRARSAGPLSRAKRNQRNAQTPVTQGERLLKELDQQLAPLAENDPARAGLVARRAQVARKLSTDTRALNAAKQATERAQTAMDKIHQGFRDTDAAINACTKWRLPTPCADALILAGTTVFAGGKGQVVAVDAASGKQLWTAKVDGAAKGLAVAAGRLFVSTDTGAIYCFGPEGSTDLGTVRQTVNPAPFEKDKQTPAFEAAAEDIIRRTGITRGYCLVLGTGTGRLVYELAKRTELQFVCACPIGERVARAKKAFDAAGLYGSRIIHRRTDLDEEPYSDYFANLIISEGPLTKNMMRFDPKEVLRMLKPVGGTLIFGQPAAARATMPRCSADFLRKWIEPAGLEGATVTDDETGTWLTYTRGKLPGAGSWTHQYAEPGNTTCSDDELVKAPLGVLWFGEPGPGDMVERHRRAASPLALNGRLIIQGFNVLKAYDAYNGLFLWERKIPGAIRVSISHEASNLCADATTLFAAVADKCLRIDSATGKTLQTYAMPPATDARPRHWGYVACVDGVLYGTRTAQGRSADCLFALDAETGNLRWKHEGRSIPQGAISIGGGRVHFAKSDITDAQRDAALAELAAQIRRLDPAKRKAAQAKLDKAIVQLVVAADAKTGKTLWERPLEVTEASGGSYWCSLGSIHSRDTLILFGVFLDGHYWNQFFAGQFDKRRIMALDAVTGKPRWTKHIGYRVRPIVVGDTLHAEPWAFDLYTGAQRTRPHPITGQEEVWQFARPGHHCGAPAASPHVMLFRSHNLAWYDLDGDYGTQHFGGQRPGCWINFIPANGLLMVPEASSGCQCPFPNMCTIVFKPRKEGRQWAYYSVPGDITPVRRLALNLGAPGDRKAPDGTLWLGYPRPGGRLVFQLKAELSYFGGWSLFNHDPARLDIAGTDIPWVYRSGVRGLQKLAVPVLAPDDGTARYTVRLAFADVEQAARGVRVFDIKIQGKTVAEGFDVAAAAGGQNKAVIKEFKGIEATGKVTVELVAKAKTPEGAQMPILQGIDIEREAIVSLGFAVPSFVLNDLKPQQAGEIRMANHRDADFEGTLRIESPKNFAVTPAETPVKLAAGKRVAIPLEAMVTKPGERGTVAATVRLVRADGQIEAERKAQIEYLGDIARVTIKATEDTYVGKDVANAKTAAAGGKLWVDGGNAKMGDESHHIVYLRFPLAIPGKVVSAKLRLYNAGNPTSHSGAVHLVESAWSQSTITYAKRPKPGRKLVSIGRVTENQVLELPFELDFAGRTELSLALVPVNCDGTDYLSREAGKPAELVVEYQK